MKTFIKKHFGTLVLAPAFACYILLLPARNEVHLIKNKVGNSDTNDHQLKNISLVSGFERIGTASWIFRFGADQ